MSRGLAKEAWQERAVYTPEALGGKGPQAQRHGAVGRLFAGVGRSISRSQKGFPRKALISQTKELLPHF